MKNIIITLLFLIIVGVNIFEGVKIYQLNKENERLNRTIEYVEQSLYQSADGLVNQFFNDIATDKTYSSENELKQSAVDNVQTVFDNVKTAINKANDANNN